MRSKYGLSCQADLRTLRFGVVFPDKKLLLHARIMTSFNTQLRIEGFCTAVAVHVP